MFGLSFLMGGMLVALAGVSIPIIIHLLHRQRTQPIQWGAMQFLLESPLQQKRRKTVDHWLLMLLRMLVIALMAFLLSRPLWVSGKYNPLANNLATDVAIVLDHSLSTGRRGGERTVYEQGVAALDGLTQSGVLRKSDTVSIVLAEHEPRRFTPLPVAPGRLSDELNKLRRLKPGLSDASIPDAVQAARDLITRKGRNTRKVVIVVSDAQRTGWQVESLNAWNAALGQRIKGVEPPVKMYELSIPPDPSASNVTVADVTVAPNLVAAGRPAQINATVINNGSKDLPAMTAKLSVGGKMVTQQPVAALTVGQSRTLHFEHSFTDAGSNWVEVSVDAADALQADNSAVVSVFAWQTLPVLIIDGKLTSTSPAAGTGPGADPAASQLAAFTTFRNSRFLQMAMLSDAASPDSMSVIRPTVVGSLDSKVASHLDEYACVVVNDVPRLVPEIQSKLADYVRSGHGVWFILGDRTEQTFVKDGLSQAGLFQTGGDPAPRQSPGDRHVGLSVNDAKNVMLAQLTSPEHNVLTGVKTFKWWAIKPEDRNRKVLLSTDTGDPLIVDRPLGANGGYVVLWATPVDGAVWNNWPGEKLFAPLVNETIYHLAGGQIKGMENRRLESGDKIVWTGPAKPVVQKVEVTRPDGTKAERHPFTRDGRQILIYGDTDLPGKYELRFDQSAIAPVYYGVGINRNELDETTLSDADRAWLMHPDHKYLEERIDAKNLATALGAPNKGTELWPYLAAFVLATLLGETFMTYRLIRRQSGPAPDAVLAGSVAPVRV